MSDEVSKNEALIQGLMNSAYEKFNSVQGRKWNDRWDDETLTAKEKVAVMFGNMNYQVNNGGLVQWHDNGYSGFDGVSQVKNQEPFRVYECIAEMVCRHRDLDPEVADTVYEMMRRIHTLPDDEGGYYETVTVWDDELEEDVEDEEWVEENVVGPHLKDMDDRYYKFDEERVMAFVAGIVGRWDDAEDPCRLSHTFVAKRDAEAEKATGVKYPEVSVKLVGEDGNAGSIIGRVSTALKRAGVSAEEVTEFRREAMSGDYDNVLSTAMKWVNCDGMASAPRM